MNNKLQKFEIIEKDTGNIVDKNIYDEIKKENNSVKIKKIYRLLEKDPSKLSKDDLIILLKLQNRPTSPNNIKLDFGEDGYFTCKRDLNMVLQLHDYTKAFLYSISHMITHDGRLKYNNNHLIPNISKLKRYLNISNDKWNDFIKPDIDKYNIIAKEKIDNNWCILLNPIFAKKENFTLTKEVYNIFKEDILENIDFVIEGVNNKEIFEHISDDLKQVLSPYKYSIISYKFSKQWYTVLNYDVGLGGVYLLYNGDDIVYIGKSKNIKNRILDHKKDKIFDSVKSIVFKDKANINLYEPYLIQKYKPMYNKDLIVESESGIILPEIELK